MVADLLSSTRAMMRSWEVYAERQGTYGDNPAMDIGIFGNARSARADEDFAGWVS